MTRFAALILLPMLLLASCATNSTRHVMLVSVRDQKMAVYQEGSRVATYPISTSKFGLGDKPGSNRTPIGKMEVARKIGGGQPLGMVFKGRRPTGEVLRPNAPGRDPIVTRILWLRGNEAKTKNAYRRFIYIHGTPEERKIGRPASYGCIRMRSRDVARLYRQVGVGTKVEVTMGPLPAPQVAQQMKRAASAVGGAVYNVATLGGGIRNKS
ncbi:L,D-transpeptidase [Verrucomicrobiales bacterium]|nr:L,D-transpeptidase [Verrucomicrobiales bacterium]